MPQPCLTSGRMGSGDEWPGCAQLYMLFWSWEFIYMKRGMYMFSQRMQRIDASMLQPYLTPGRMSSYTCIVGGYVLHQWLEITYTEHVFLYSTQPRPSSDTRSNGFELLAGTLTSCLQEKKKHSFHTIALHHHNCTQRAHVCTQRQKKLPWAFCDRRLNGLGW